MIIPKISSKTISTKESSFDPLIVECPPTNNIKTASIAMVGESPNDIDILKEEPFMGPIGSQFNRICAACRIARYQIYLTYACKAKFPKNNPSCLLTPKGFRHPAWGELQAQLIDELSNFEGKVILLLGNVAMRLLIDEPRFNSITKYRGSFYHAEEFPHLKDKLAGKIIGLSFDPSFTMQYGQPVHFYTMIADFIKAMKVIENPSLIDDEPILYIRPTFKEIMTFYSRIKED